MPTQAGGKTNGGPGGGNPQPDLATAWTAGTQADLFRLLAQSASNNRRMDERFHQVADAQASRLTGTTIDSKPEGDDSVRVRVNSDDFCYPQPPVIINNPPPPPAPQPVIVNPPSAPPLPAWAKVAMAAILAAALVLPWILSRSTAAPTPTPSPAPAQGWDVEISVR